MPESIFSRRDALVVEHLALVPPIARRISRSLPPSFDLDDLIGAGNLGLVTAAARYRPGLHGGTPFSAYARVVIRGFILSSVRRGAYVEATRPALGEVHVLPSTVPALVESIDRGRQRWRLEVAVARLEPRQRAAVELHYTEELPLREVAERYGVGRAQASRLHVAAVKVLRARLVG